LGSQIVANYPRFREVDPVLAPELLVGIRFGEFTAECVAAEGRFFHRGEIIPQLQHFNLSIDAECAYEFACMIHEGTLRRGMVEGFSHMSLG
jgi:hypothetical protein